MPKRSTIPVHKLQEHTDQRYHLERVDCENDRIKNSAPIDAHRDDHYIFMVLEKGWSRMMVDFQQYEYRANTVNFVLPGQVHDLQGMGDDTIGWYLALEPGLIPDLFRAVLEDPLLHQKPLTLDGEMIEAMAQCLKLAHMLRRQQESVYSRECVFSLLGSFVGLIADCYAGRPVAADGKLARPKMITLEFRQMVTQRFRTMKSPGDYAEAMHLSLSYLNEIVKETTGFPVSYWIQQEVILEAKRLLYYSQCSVKEIAFELGYEDHTYFSRLFKKQAGQTPGEFRGEYRGETREYRE
jgi:AraC family transcriptional activator of pobA